MYALGPPTPPITTDICWAWIDPLDPVVASSWRLAGTSALDYMADAKTTNTPFMSLAPLFNRPFILDVAYSS